MELKTTLKSDKIAIRVVGVCKCVCVCVCVFTCVPDVYTVPQQRSAVKCGSGAGPVKTSPLHPCQKQSAWIQPAATPTQLLQHAPPEDIILLAYI